jgi:heterodisulfide reductase subunit C
MEQSAAKEANSAKPALPNVLAPVQEMVRACIQCGTCSASCPNEFAMNHTPRMLWRMVLMGMKDQIFQSQTFALCSSCYCCTLRCPRGLPLTEAMAALKQIAARKKQKNYRHSTLFYKNFLRSVRRHGRVNEMEFMALYFADMRNPLIPLRFASLGTRLMQKKKVSLAIPLTARRPLEAIFQNVEAMEDWR